MNTILSVNEILNSAKEFDGWLLSDEFNLIFETVSSLKTKGAIVEIGSWCGKSLSVIAAATIKSDLSNDIYSIDPFLTSKDEPNGMYEKFVSNMKSIGIWDRIKHIKEKSQIAGTKFDKDIAFIFIDGFHKYDAVSRDFELFFPRIVNEGFIAFHDVKSFYGPTKLVCELLESRNDFKFVQMSNMTFLAQKVKALSEIDKQNNLAMLTSLKTYMAQNTNRLTM